MNVKVQSFAKINLVLDLLCKRPDGYHELASIMQSVSLADTITLTKTNSLQITLTTNRTVTKDPQKNLAYKAAEKFLAAYPQKSGLNIHLEKNIPIAAGLAGGSTDCAGVLTGLNKLFSVNLTIPQLSDIANSLGSDIAFCLEGGTMLAEGRGEKLTKLPFVGNWFGLILKPPFPISTAETYRKVPENHQSKRSDQLITQYQQQKINLNNLKTSIKNDLYPFSVQLQPELTNYLQKINETNPVACQMSGSGPAIFAFYADQNTQQAALEILSKKNEVCAIKTIEHGQKFI